MGMKTHRVAVVGCGAIGRSMHLPNCVRNPRIELVATCDQDGTLAEECRAAYGAQRAETDWRRVVASDDIDLCILATHTNLRADFIIPALEAGKAVYTEKPLAPCRAAMLRIVKAVRETGCPVCVGHNRRSSPAMLAFRRMLERAGDERTIVLPPSIRHSEGLCAPLPEERGLQLLARVNDDLRSWKEWIFSDTEGIMFAEMVHFIDLALWLNPGHPVRVFAEGSPRGNFTLLLRFDDGSLTTLQHTMVGHFDYPKELFEATRRNVTVGMEQHVEVRQCGLADEPELQYFPFHPDSAWVTRPGVRGCFEDGADERRRSQAEGRLPRSILVDKGHFRHLDRFLDHIEGVDENPCPVESAVAVNQVALKCLESARLGLPVSVGPEDWHLPAFAQRN